MRSMALLAVAGCSFTGRAIASDGAIDAINGVDAVRDAPHAEDAAPPDWWDPAFRWRMPIAITNGASVALPAGYQIGLRHDLDAMPCSSDRAASRIVWQKTEIDRIVDEVGAPAEWTWFRLQAAMPAGATSTEYWLYCGNPSPSAPAANPKTVFEFYDDFDEAALDNSVWTKLNTVALQNGKLVCGGANLADNGIVTTTLAYAKNHAVDFVAIASSTTSSNFWAGFQNGTQDVAPWLHWYTKDLSSICPDFRGVAADPAWYGTDIPLDTLPHFYSIENYGTASRYRRDDASIEMHTYAPMSPPPAMVNVRLWNGSSTTTVAYDMVRVRQAVDPPPLTTVGAAMSY